MTDSDDLPSLTDAAMLLETTLRAQQTLQTLREQEALRDSAPLPPTFEQLHECQKQPAEVRWNDGTLEQAWRCECGKAEWREVPQNTNLTE